MTRILDYQLSCIGGLEDVVVDELRAHLGKAATGVRPERGAAARIFLQTEASPRRLLQLACPTAVHAVAAQAHDVTVGAPGLTRILSCVRRLPLDALRRLAGACAPSTDAARYRLRVSLTGAHRFAATQVEAGAHEALHALGLETATAPGEVLDLGIHVRKRRALVTLRLGPRRPSGDPVTEGWAGPAAASVMRLVDLDADALVAIPGDGGAGLWLHSAAGSQTLPAAAGVLPLAAGCVSALLWATADGQDEDHAIAEAARVVAPGGVAALLVDRGDAFAARLRGSGAPFEVMAGLPFYCRRRRRALFLLERLDLLGIAGI